MPLLIPALANRDFDQIVAEGRGLLPRLSPAWTDYNTSDPGITVMELLGSRLEETLYRLDRTPPALARNFAGHVGIEPMQALVAETILLISATNAPFVLAEGTQVAAGDGEAIFQTIQDLPVSAAVLKRIVAGGVDVPVNGNVPWFAFGADPAPGSDLYLGFDRPLGALGVVVRVYAWTSDPAGDRGVRTRLVAEQDAMKAVAAHCAVGCAPDTPDWRLHYSVRTVWEFHAGGGIWSALEDVIDATRALSLSGAVEFRAPAGHIAGGPDPSLFFIRCRIVRGSFECPPRLGRIAHNAVAAQQAVDVAQPRVLGASLGHAYERFLIEDTPVVPGSTALVVTTSSSPDTSWREVPNWDGSGAHDKHYVLDPLAGTLTGGNGAVARVWPAGAVLSAVYRIGGGVQGNVAAHTLVRVPDSALNTARYQAANGGASPDWTKCFVDQPIEALGGADAEDLDATKARAFVAAFDMNRAVTCDDFERLAKSVPAVPVARAHALANYFPDMPCFDAAGCVTVIVVPACPDHRPVPSPDYLAAVRQYLDRRRTLTTEVHVRPACWWQVGVCAELFSDGRLPPSAIESAARTALADFFHPLKGGPDAAGWPIGRSVYRSEVMAVLSRVPGVAVVSSLGLRGEGDGEPHCGNVPLCPDCLVRLEEIDLCVIGPAPLPIIDRSKPHECP